jgi:hypothetical protein
MAFDDDSAWHGARASTWANTPMAKLLRPWQDLVREKLHSLENTLPPEKVKLAWFHLTNSFNSDGQWPPTLPDAPHIIHPFNYNYNFENLLMAEQVVGGIDRRRLTVDPLQTLQTILGIQQNMVLEKAKKMLSSKKANEVSRAKEAIALIESSMNVDELKNNRPSVLYPMEYKTRADALVKARRLVGGVLIEKTDTGLKQKK